MRSITFLGIGSNSFGELSTSSFAMAMDDNSWMLVDCGPDTPRQLGAAKIPLLSIEYVVITHRHLDHCLGLPYFLFGRNLERISRQREIDNFPVPPLTIVAEREVWEALWGLFQMAHPDTQNLGFPIHFIEINSLLGERHKLGEVDMQAFAMNHAVPAFGFVAWQDEEKLLAYSTDTLPVEGFMDIAINCQIAIHEAMVPGSDTGFANSAKHSTAAQAGLAISRIRPNKAFLMHLRPAYINKKAAIEEEASTGAGMPVRFPKEGEVVMLLNGV